MRRVYDPVAEWQVIRPEPAFRGVTRNDVSWGLSDREFKSASRRWGASLVRNWNRSEQGDS